MAVERYPRGPPGPFSREPAGATRPLVARATKHPVAKNSNRTASASPEWVRAARGGRRKGLESGELPGRWCQPAWEPLAQALRAPPRFPRPSTTKTTGRLPRGFAPGQGFLYPLALALRPPDPAIPSFARLFHARFGPAPPSSTASLTHFLQTLTPPYPPPRACSEEQRRIGQLDPDDPRPRAGDSHVASPRLAQHPGWRSSLGRTSD